MYDKTGKTKSSVKSQIPSNTSYKKISLLVKKTYLTKVSEISYKILSCSYMILDKLFLRNLIDLIRLYKEICENYFIRFWEAFIRHKKRSCKILRNYSKNYVESTHKKLIKLYKKHCKNFCKNPNY